MNKQLRPKGLKAKTQTVFLIWLSSLAGWYGGSTSAATPTTSPSSPAVQAPLGWQTASPRPEIAPEFFFDPRGGPSAHGSWILQGNGRLGLDGCWRKSFPVTGGRYYRFRVLRKTVGVESPRRSAVARLLWRDDRGASVLTDEPMVPGVLPGFRRTAEPEYPATGGTLAQGWTEITGVYRAPPRATEGVVELYLRWAPQGIVKWSQVALTGTTAPKPREVRLAAVHYRPHGGKSPMDNCRQFARFIQEAAERKADLVVLPETLTYYGLGKSYLECAQPVPGPATVYFGKLARRYNLYIVAGLLERAGHLVYNVAVLIGPEGKVVGKYRKVALPRSEIAGGVTPGHEYPVFNTRFGKVGMMVCYDGFFPEVARKLAMHGAEVIAWPVWGCNPLLARARACENHVYIVSSTYEDVSHHWMRTAVFNPAGRAIVEAKNWGTVVVAQVDLNRRFLWPSLGDFKAEIPHHRPLWGSER